MSAHDATGNDLAHDSAPPIENGKTKLSHINIDATGISMSAKTAYRVLIAIVVFIFVLAGGWYSFLMTSATKADIAAHNIDTQASAHPVKLYKEADPVGLIQVVKKHEKEIAEVNGGMEALKDAVGENKTIIITVKNGFHEDRAERLADQAAKKVRGADRKLKRWQHVKRKALSNLKAEPPKPLRDGLENYL